MQPAGGIYDQQVRLLGLGALDGVVHHGGGIGPLLVLHDRHPGPLRPDRQLLRRRGPEGVPGAEHDLPADGLEPQGQLADGGGLAHAVHAHHQHDHGPAQRGPGNIHLLDHDLLQDFPGGAGVLHVLLFHPFPQLADNDRRGLQPAVRHDQDILQLLVEILVNLPVFPDHIVDLLGHIPPGFAQPGPQTGKQALFLLVAHGSSLRFRE